MLLENNEQSTPARRADVGWRSQFARPRGWLGWLIGHLLAVKNQERSVWVLSLLELRDRDRVLEIGFGPGADIRRVAAVVRNGFVAGIDHSETMVRQASSRNAAAIRAGRVELRHRTASRLPYDPDSFDTVFSINAAQFWEDLTGTAREIRRVLKPGGKIALVVQPRNQGATEATVQETGEKLMHALTAAGFAGVRLEQKVLKPVSVVCALGVK